MSSTARRGHSTAARRQDASVMTAERRVRTLRLALLHVNLLLVVGAGALLLGGARLAWDPTAYIALREIWPTEHAVATVALPAAGLTLLVLANVAAAAATIESAQNALLVTYVCGAGGMCVLAAAWGVWTWAQLNGWWVEEGQTAAKHGSRVAESVMALMESLAELPGGAGAAAARLLELEREARVRGLRLVRTWAVAGGLLVTLQMAALALAVAALLLGRKREHNKARITNPLLHR